MNHLLALIARWSACRCCCMRAPTDPCRCVWLDGRWGCDNPVADGCDEPTPKERAENRKLRGQP